MTPTILILKVLHFRYRTHDDPWLDQYGSAVSAYRHMVCQYTACIAVPRRGKARKEETRQRRAGRGGRQEEKVGRRGRGGELLGMVIQIGRIEI